MVKSMQNEAEERKDGSRRKVGLRDLARIASVDVSTVSRALNHDSRVSESRGKMIRELARREGYRPKPLRSKRTQAIGILIGSDQSDKIGGVGEHFLERIVWVAQQILSKQRMHVNVECFLRSSDGKQLPAIVQENRVDGLLLAGHPSVELVASIRKHGLPVVAINDSAERLQIPCICSNPRTAIHEAILRLAAWGHKRFGLLMNDLEYPTSKARVEAFHAALADISIAVNPDWVVTNLPHEITGGREGVRELIRRGDVPTVILCCNDWVALGAFMELQANGFKVPQDVSLVGHDDVSFCQTIQPKLTSISRSEQDMVSEGIRLLLKAVDGKEVPAKNTTVEGSVVWRESTGPTAVRLKESDLKVGAE